jgi:hypothetical protein
MKCVLCNTRKGKRFCPAKGAPICPQCCGEKRILEIDCPESCPYLQVGRSHEARHENMRHLRTADPAKLQARARLFDLFEPQIARIEYLLARQRHRVRDLRDAEAAEALDLLIATYRTEDRGILYEQASSNLRVDALRRELRDALQELREPKDERQERLRLSDLIACLEMVREILASHMQAGESPSSYVDFLARMMPRQAPASSGPLIIPG